MRLAQLLPAFAALLARQPPRLSLTRKALLRRAVDVRQAPEAPPNLHGPQDPERALQWLANPFDFAPVEVCDVCGGAPGHTYFSEVSVDCSNWAVTFSRCAQGCKQTNYLKGFGDCMDRCGVVLPTPDLCGAGVVTAEISNYCEHTVGKVHACNCTNPEVQAADELIVCLDTCVFKCEHSLTEQLNLGIPMTWRQRKCPRKVFGCGGPQQCEELPQCGPWDTKGCIEAECKSPVGHGDRACYHDDPHCGVSQPEAAADPLSVCPAPPPPPPEPVVLNVTCGNGTNGTNGTNSSCSNATDIIVPPDLTPRRRTPWYPRR